jgi:eukaryotic-like serine/threonine-protein kinase
MSSDDRLIELLVIWEEARKDGRDLSPEEICPENASLREALRDRICKRKQLHRLIDVPTLPVFSGTAELGANGGPPGYELLSELGRGGMGVVYKALHVKLNRLVALKMIRGGAFAGSEQVARFRLEAEAVAKLSHPNIVPIFDVGELSGQPFFTLEFLVGGNLATRLAGIPQPSRQVGKFVATLARAVHEVHGIGIVHRDLKPSNILLASDAPLFSGATPKIADFGLARKIDEDSGQTFTHQVLGSPSYMSPEQAAGDKAAIGASTDIYALGAILYEMLVGRPPFRGASITATIEQVRTQEPISPRSLIPTLERDLETICLKCLRKNPVQRYGTAADLADDLQRYVDGVPIRARPVGRAERTWRWCRRNRWAAAFIALLIVATAVSSGLAVWAVRAQRAALASEKRAKQASQEAAAEANIAKAVDEFLNKDLLAQAGANHQGRGGVRPDPNLTVRVALDRAAATIGRRFSGQPRVEASIHHTIGQTYLELGLYGEARPHLERALALRRDVLGASHPESLVAMQSLGTLFLSDGKISEAEPLLVPALDGLRRIRGESHPETLSAMKSVGRLYTDQEEFEKAEQFLRTTLDRVRGVWGDEHSETLEVLGDLATALQSQAKFAESEPLLARVVAVSQKREGPEHPQTLTAKACLAAAWFGLGRRTEAIQTLEEVMPHMRRVLGNSHPDTLIAMGSLGEMYLSYEARWPDAEAILIEAWKGSRETLDNRHLTRDAILALLAALYSQKKELDKIEPYLMEAVEITRFRWGPDHGMTASANRAAASFFFVRSQFAKAEPYLRALLQFEAKTNPRNWTRFDTERRLGDCLGRLRNFDEAEQLLLSAYSWMKSREKNLTPEQAEALKDVMNRLIQLYDNWGKPEIADEWRRKQGTPSPRRELKTLPSNPFQQ